VCATMGLWWPFGNLPWCANLSCSVFSSWLNSSRPCCQLVAGCWQAGISILCKILRTFSF
ncbi:hypothetical protein N303_09579, partial [Cuculus canorus]